MTENETATSNDAEKSNAITQCFHLFDSLLSRQLYVRGGGGNRYRKFLLLTLIVLFPILGNAHSYLNNEIHAIEDAVEKGVNEGYIMYFGALSRQSVEVVANKCEERCNTAICKETCPVAYQYLWYAENRHSKLRMVPKDIAMYPLGRALMFAKAIEAENDHAGVNFKSKSEAECRNRFEQLIFQLLYRMSEPMKKFAVEDVCVTTASRLRKARLQDEVARLQEDEQ